MSTDRKVLNKMVLHALSGKGAHIAVNDAFTGLDWKLAGVQVEDISHSVFALLSHMIFWNHWVVEWLGGQKPAVPKHAKGSWPGNVAPQNAEEWRAALRQFERYLAEMARAAGKLDLLAKKGTKTPLEMLQTIALHNSYHLGQVVVIRQKLGAWPPPSGGLTW